MQKQRRAAGSFPEMKCAGISLKHSTASALPLLAPAGFPGSPGVPGHLTAILGGVPLLLTPPATSHPYPHSLRLASLTMVVGLSFPGRLTCPLRPRKCLTLPPNALPPMTPVSSQSAGAGRWGGMNRGWRPCSPSFPSGSLRLPAESWVFRGCLSFHDSLYLTLRRLY